MIPALSGLTVQCNDLYLGCLGTSLEGCIEQDSQAMVFLSGKHATPDVGADRGARVHLWQVLAKPGLLGGKIGSCIISV